MKVELDTNLEAYIRSVLSVTTKSMIVAISSALTINAAWFFFDDFTKTLIQEVVILTALTFSIFNYRSLKRGNIIRAAKTYVLFGSCFGMIVIWMSGDLFVFTGFFVHTIISLFSVFTFRRKEAKYMILLNFITGTLGLYLRYALNIWGSDYTPAELIQLFFFMCLIMGSMGFFGYKISLLLKTALINVNEKNTTLYQLSITDKLTGLNNRMRLDRVLMDEAERARRYCSVFSVILMDIDHFKRVNDTFGHQIGDETLIRFADLIRNNIRSTDIAGRWGGEEFLVICPETDLESARNLAEKLRVKIEDYSFPGVPGQTASFGINQFYPENEVSRLIGLADDALYRAKETGRNRVCSESPALITAEYTE